MVTDHTRYACLSRWIILLGLLGGITFSTASALGQAQDSAPNADATDILDLAWANGVELLAGRQMSLDEGQYEWRITMATAGQEAGEPIETGHGVLLSVSGPLHVLVDDSTLVELKPGAALALDEGSEIVAVSRDETEVDYLLIELITAEDAERVITSETVELVGPVRILEDGEYGLVMLNLPVAVTIDVAPDEVIEGSIRPAVSIAHIGNEIPENLSNARNYDRWIVALYPIAGDVPVATATVAPVQSTSAPAPPTSAPVQPPSSTQPPTVAPTASGGPTAAPTATNVPTQVPTAVPSPTDVPPPPTDVPPPPTDVPPPPTDVPPPPTDVPPPPTDVPPPPTDVPPPPTDVPPPV